MTAGTTRPRSSAETSRVAGGFLLLLAAYILIDADVRLFGDAGGTQVERGRCHRYGGGARSNAGSRVAQTSHAQELGSRALRTDAFESITCTTLSATTPAGLVTNFAFGGRGQIR